MAFDFGIFGWFWIPSRFNVTFDAISELKWTDKNGSEKYHKYLFKTVWMMETGLTCKQWFPKKLSMPQSGFLHTIARYGKCLLRL